MVRTIRERAIVGPEGRVVIAYSDLPEGSMAEVIAVVDDSAPTGEGRPLSSYIGLLKGQFTSQADVDEYVRKLRDEWDQE